MKKVVFIVGLLVLGLLISCSSDSFTEGSDGGGNGNTSPWKYDVMPANSDASIYGGEGGIGDVCGEAEFAITHQTPDMFILLDRSNSMTDSVGVGGKTIWATVKEAINSVTSSLESQILFGLTLFPNAVTPNTCAGINNQCTAANAKPLVELKINNSALIQTTLAAQSTCGGTPTAKSLTAAHTYLKGLADTNTKFILLATDGMPNCDETRDGCAKSCVCTGEPENCCDSVFGSNGGNCLDDVATHNALDALKNDGIKTFVVGLGTKVANETELQNMAVHGGTTNYYKADDATKIKTAFEQIAGQVLTCKFDLDCTKIEDENKINFYFDDKVVGQDATNTKGWNWVTDKKCQNQTGTGTVEFFGDDCAAIKNNQVKKVSAKFGCKTIIV